MAVSNIDLRVDSRQAVSGLRAAQKQVGLLNGATKGLLKTMGPLAVAFSGVALVRNYFKGFNEAEKATQALKTLGVEAKVLNSKLLEVSNSLGGLYSQTQLTTAAYDVASAGFVKAADAAAVLEASALGAKGGLSDLNTVGNAVTSVLNAYGKSAKESERLVDGFIQTQNDGKIILDQYAKFIGRLAPTAAATNVSIEELNAAISTITAQGVPVQATFTGLNQALVSILKPSAEAEKLAKKLGIEFNEAGLRSQGFADFMADVKAKTGGSTTALVKLFGSVDALKAVLPLLNDDLVSFNRNLEKQTNSAGTATAASELMSQTLSSQFSEVVNTVGNLVRVLDQALGPALKDILTTIKNIVGKAAEAVMLMNDLIMGEGYRQLGSGAVDITMSKLAPGFGLEGQGAQKLLSAAQGINPASAQNMDELNKMYSLIEKVANQAGRIKAGGSSQPIRDAIFSRWQEVREEINIRMTELKALEAENNGEISNGNSNLQERLDILAGVEDALNSQGTTLTKTEQMWATMADTIQNGVVDAIQGAINGTKTLGEVASSVFQAIQRQVINYAVGSLMDSTGWFPKRSVGGPVSKDQPYLVGERGPELFVPRSGGKIVSSNNVGGGSTNVVVNVDASGSQVQGDENQAAELGNMLAGAVQAELIRQQRPGGLLAG